MKGWTGNFLHRGWTYCSVYLKETWCAAKNIILCDCLSFLPSGLRCENWNSVCCLHYSANNATHFIHLWLSTTPQVTFSVRRNVVFKSLYFAPDGSQAGDRPPTPKPKSWSFCASQVKQGAVIRAFMLPHLDWSLGESQERQQQDHPVRKPDQSLNWRVSMYKDSSLNKKRPPPLISEDVANSCRLNCSVISSFCALLPRSPPNSLILLLIFFV